MFAGQERWAWMDQFYEEAAEIKRQYVVRVALYEIALRRTAEARDINHKGRGARLV